MAIKTCIIGCGRNANHLHKPPIMKHPEFELTGVYDIDREASSAMAKECGCKVFESLDEVKKSDVEFCVVVTYNINHQPISVELLRAGKNVLVTKPWALNAKEAVELLTVARENNKIVIPWFPMHWHTQHGIIKDIIDSGKIGKVFHITRHQCTFGIRLDWQMWKEYAGGYLYNWGPHLVQQVLDVAGERISQVYAETRLVINPGDTEDVFLAMMKTESGIVINLEYNIDTGLAPNWIIRGDKGTIYVHDDLMSEVGNLTLHQVVQPEKLDPKAYRNPYKINETKIAYNYHELNSAYDIYTHIADVINGKAEYEIPHEFSYHVTQVMEAILKSSATNSIIRL